MPPPDSKHWMHPQAVPRGFLRLYLLAVLSRHQETGYSIMQIIDEKTEGAWRPGPGTIYPLLKSLEKECLVKAGAHGKEGRIEYSVTERGKEELEQMQKTLTSAGKKERVMMRLFSDLLPPKVITSMIINRYREGSELFRGKVGQIPKPERASVLKEMEVFTEAELLWIRSELGYKTKP